MKFLWLVFLTVITSCGSLCGINKEEKIYQKTQELKDCFENCWGIDIHTTAYLCKYFKAFLEKEDGHPLINYFINKSLQLNIQFPAEKELPILSPHDGVVQATKFHPVVFETPYVRIMAGCAEPGEREPFHTHSWKSLLVVFEAATYLVEYANGTHERLSLPAGVYELPPEDFYACTNLGSKKENCLRFEVKD